jgi:chromosome segregation ATPase
MQTMAPPEEALTEPFARIDERFDRVDESFAGVDKEFARVNERIVEVNRRITETAKETNRRLEGVEATNVELRHQMTALNVTFQRGSFAIVASVLGVIAAILAKGG